MTAPTITVIAKIDAGLHPEFGMIVRGQSYIVPADCTADQLFDLPPQSDSAPAAAGKKARS